MGYYIPRTGETCTPWDSYIKVFRPEVVLPLGKHCFREELFPGAGFRGDERDGVVVGIKRDGYVGRHRLEDAQRDIDFAQRPGYYIYFDDGKSCPHVGCGHGWRRAGSI